MKTVPTETAQREKGLWSLLFKPKVFDSFTKIVGGDAVRQMFVERFIRPRSQDRVLDVGCGTARILDHLSVGRYVGIDNNHEYISSARQRYKDRGEFIVGDVGSLALQAEDRFEIVLAIGILHHIGDESARRLLAAAKPAISDGGRIVIIDPVFAPGQSMAAKFVVSLDRGRNVRTPEQYIELARSSFDHVRYEICELHKWLPFTQFIMECK